MVSLVVALESARKVGRRDSERREHRRGIGDYQSCVKKVAHFPIDCVQFCFIEATIQSTKSFVTKASDVVAADG
eukprot:g59568.t1